MGDTMSQWLPSLGTFSGTYEARLTWKPRSASEVPASIRIQTHEPELTASMLANVTPQQICAEN